MNSSKSKRAQAEKIVKAVLKDLAGRRGIGDELEQIDEDVMEELIDTLQNKVEALL